MTGEQIRMARALLRLTLRDLADLASVDKKTLVRLEWGTARGHASTLQKIRGVLEERGVVFLPPVEPVHGPAVALKWGVELKNEASGLKRLAVLLHLA